ncbi:MAG: hypothetical protein RLZZ86_3859 [Cyanobacteriota bacterium]|jgi:hypothetical protein
MVLVIPALYYTVFNRSTDNDIILLLVLILIIAQSLVINDTRNLTTDH